AESVCAGCGPASEQGADFRLRPGAEGRTGLIPGDDLPGVRRRGALPVTVPSMHGAAPSGPGPHRGALTALDCAAAAAYTSLSTATALVGGPPAPAAAVTALTAAVGLPVAARRLLPRTVFWTVLAVSLPAVLLGVVGDPLLAAGFALYTVAAEERGPAGRAPVVVGAVAAAALLAAAIGGWDGSAALPDRLGLLVSGAAVLVGAWAVGRSVHDRRVQA